MVTVSHKRSLFIWGQGGEAWTDTSSASMVCIIYTTALYIVYIRSLLVNKWTYVSMKLDIAHCSFVLYVESNDAKVQLLHNNIIMRTSLQRTLCHAYSSSSHRKMAARNTQGQLADNQSR